MLTASLEYNAPIIRLCFHCTGEINTGDENAGDGDNGSNPGGNPGSDGTAVDSNNIAGLSTNDAVGVKGRHLSLISGVTVLLCVLLSVFLY